MSAAAYRLPDGTIPVLLSADTPELLDSEATALRDHVAAHPDLTPGPISAMLFRTRAARRHRALAMVRTRAELIDALQAMIDRYEHPALIRTDPAAIRRRIGYVFPGQGGQRPGMGQLFYESVPAFRAEVDRCAQAFEAQSCGSPRNYLLDKNFQDDGSAGIVQPALFTQMAALAAMWRSFDIPPNVTIGHSQGEVAAAYVSGTITLEDAVRVIGIRAHAADEFAAADYAMAIVAADREACEDLLARCSGWAQLSVVNSPRMVGISGERETVQGIVDTLTEGGTFARVIRVRYPAHTSLIHDVPTNFVQPSKTNCSTQVLSTPTSTASVPLSARPSRRSSLSVTIVFGTCATSFGSTRQSPPPCNVTSKRSSNWPSIRRCSWRFTRIWPPCATKPMTAPPWW